MKCLPTRFICAMCVGGRIFGLKYHRKKVTNIWKHTVECTGGGAPISNAPYKQNLGEIGDFDGGPYKHHF